MTRFVPRVFEDTIQGQQRQAMSCDMLFELGLSCSIGHDGALDLISAHKWFNIAALRGKREAVSYRQDIARELNDEQIAEAQRAAREWLRSH